MLRDGPVLDRSAGGRVIRDIPVSLDCPGWGHSPDTKRAIRDGSVTLDCPGLWKAPRLVLERNAVTFAVSGFDPVDGAAALRERRGIAYRNNSLLPDDERCLHPERAVICHAAKQPVRPGQQLELPIDRLAGLRHWKRVHTRSPNPTQLQVVGILAAVAELDDRPAGLDRLPRQDEPELLGDDLDACRWGSGGYHRTSAGREKDAAPGMTRPASTPSHCSSSEA